MKNTHSHPHNSTHNPILTHITNCKESCHKWDQTFVWGKKFAKTNKIKAKDILDAIRNIRSFK